METNIPVWDLIKTYNLKTTNKIIHEKNIAYTNKKCTGVSNYVRKMLNKKDDYEVGEKLICLNYFRTKDKKVNKNFEYTIGKITENSITLMDEVFDDKMEELILVEFVTLSKKQIETYFKHSYCFTCHSRQGSTIKQPITIH